MYEESVARKILVEAGHELLKTGLVARTWGNISARISDEEFLITPSGISYERLTPEMLVKVRISDLKYDSDLKPSSEKGIHATAYKLQKDTNFIIHTHQTFATAVSITGRAIKVKGPLQEVLGELVPVAEYGMPSTGKLKENVETTLLRNPGLRASLLINHGAVCFGHDMENAFDIAKSLEYLAKNEFDNKVTLSDEAGRFNANVEAMVKSLFEGKTIRMITDPVVLQAANSDAYNYRLLDDFIQIAGTSIKTIDFAHLEIGNKDDRRQVISRIKHALRKRNAAFVRKSGAIVVAPNEDEADAIEMILKKYALTKLYAEKCQAVHKLEFIDAFIQRLVYLKKYSKKA